MTFTARAARIGDATAIAEIYNEGIADRIATFETEARSSGQIEKWFDGRHPIVVVEGEDGVAVAFASTSRYRDRACYAGVDFRVVGTYRRHGKLEGQWRDCIIVERLLGSAQL